MKRILSFLLAVLMISIATVTVFANDGSLDDDGDVSCKIGPYREYFIYYMGIIPIQFPIWSNSSSDKLEKILDYAEEKLSDKYITYEEMKSLDDMVENAVDNMCIDSSELGWMLEYMKKDYESTGYYDETTTAEIKRIYEQAQSDYASGDEKLIHLSYVSLRNLFNNLCLYNQIPGDVNNDGILTIDDVTLMQKNFADLTQFNSSQNYVAYITKLSNIDTVTDWQIHIADMASYSINDKFKEDYENTSKIGVIDSKNKYQVFNPTTEMDNYLFFTDRYYLSCIG